MADKKKKSLDGRERVALKEGVVQKVRDAKRRTRIPISEFFETAAIEKLTRMKLHETI